MPTAPKNDVSAADAAEPLRRRILDAAFSAFSKEGYAATSTLEIATRAKVSKRELYTTVGNKQELLVACITERARRLRTPDLPPVRDRRMLERVLATFGEHQLREVHHPNVIAMFRLAIAEAERTPEIAHALDTIAREASRSRLRDIIADGLAKSLLAGDAAEMCDVFRSLLFGDVMLTWLLGVSGGLAGRDIEQRARRAAAAFMQLYAGV